MCSRSSYKLKPKNRIDKCLSNLIVYLNYRGINTVACCCGHGVYPMSIVVRNEHGVIYDIVSNRIIPRARNFYRSDGKGGWYLPEVMGTLRPHANDKSMP